MEKEQAMRLVAKVHVLHADEATDHQPCAGDQDHCESDLQRHETRSPCAAASGLPATVRPPAFNAA